MAQGSGSMGFSIGEVSQAVGLAPQTLRLWERERLITPRRTDRGYRVYSEPDVKRLREIKQLRKVEGLNFAAIRKQLGSAPEAASPEVFEDRHGEVRGPVVRVAECSQADSFSLECRLAVDRG